MGSERFYFGSHHMTPTRSTRDSYGIPNLTKAHHIPMGIYLSIYLYLVLYSSYDNVKLVSWPPLEYPGVLCTDCSPVLSTSPSSSSLLCRTPPGPPSCSCRAPPAPPSRPDTPSRAPGFPPPSCRSFHRLDYLDTCF